MKSFFPLLALLLSAAAARAQIDILTPAPEAERYTVANAPRYDSLANVSERSYAALPGQRLFMNGAREAARYGYVDTFFTADFLRDDKAPRYGGAIQSTPAELVDGRYFDVLETRIRRRGRLSACCLVLRERESGDTLYYKPTLYSRAMTCVGYYEKLKHRYVGVRMVAFGRRRVETLGGEIVTPTPGAEYRCEAVAMDLGDGPVLILADPAGCRVKATPVDEAVWEFVSEARIGEAVARYGEELGRQVALGRVVVGMTRQMADEAWGQPYRSTSYATEKGTVESLSYEGNRYLTLRDGVVAGVSGGE